MTFWQKFWKLVSKKHLIFGVLLFAAVIALSLHQSAEAVSVTFGDSAVDITASRFSMNIPYDMVEYAQLEEIPDRGDVIDGSDDMATRTGQWVNDTWGEYFICADLDASNCIAVHLNDDERELVRGLIRDGIEVEVRQVAKDKKLVISESDL